MIDEAFQGSPGVEQSHAVIVEKIAGLISRILVVPGLKREWSVNEVEIQILQTEPLSARRESWFDALRPVIVVPEFCGDEEIFALNLPFTQHAFDRFSHRLFISISLRAVELAKTDFQSSSGRPQGIAKIGNQGSKPKGRNASAVVHGDSFVTEFVRFSHWSSKR